MSLSNALQGSVEVKNIRIGAWRFFCAPYSTYIDEYQRFNTFAPPAPFLDFGACLPDAAMNFTKQFYKYMNGVPSVLKSKVITGIDLSLTVTLSEFSGRNLARALYNTNTAIKKFKASPAIVVAAAVPSGNVLQLTSSAGWTEGDFVALATSPSGLVTTADEYHVVEISGNYLIFDRDVTTVFGSAPYVGNVESWKIPFGSSRDSQISIVGVWDDVSIDSDAIQVVLAIPNAIIDGNWNSTGIPVADHQKIPMTITGKAFFDTDLNDQSVATLLRYR